MLLELKILKPPSSQNDKTLPFTIESNGSPFSSIKKSGEIFEKSGMQLLNFNALLNTKES